MTFEEIKNELAKMPHDTYISRENYILHPRNFEKITSKIDIYVYQSPDLSLHCSYTFDPSYGRLLYTLHNDIPFKAKNAFSRTLERIEDVYMRSRCLRSIHNNYDFDQIVIPF